MNANSRTILIGAGLGLAVYLLLKKGGCGCQHVAIGDVPRSGHVPPGVGDRPIGAGPNGYPACGACRS